MFPLPLEHPPTSRTKSVHLFAAWSTAFLLSIASPSLLGCSSGSPPDSAAGGSSGVGGSSGAGGGGGHGAPEGSQGGPCRADRTCDVGLLCDENNVCVASDSCNGVTCSGHGTCALNDGTATCTCTKGYHPSGLACIADEDHTPPVITDLQAKVGGSAMVEVSWTTDEPATSIVDYGEKDFSNNKEPSAKLATTHKIVLGLGTHTTYQLRVRSADIAGNEATSSPVTVTTNSIDKLRVRSGHPILFIDDAQLKLVRAKTDDTKAYHDYVLKEKMKATTDPSETAKIRAAMDAVKDYGPQDLSMYYALDAYINQDPLTKAYGKQLLLSLVERPMTLTNGDAEIRTSMYAIGMLYDWLYDDLDESLRKKARGHVLDLLDYIQEHKKHTFDPAFDTHARLGHICALVGLLPLFHDIQQDGAAETKRYMTWLDLIVGQFRLYINPDQAWASKGGMNQMGWAYGTSYASMYPYMAWQYAVDEESWWEQWQGEFFYTFMYGLRNANVHWDEHWDSFPYWGDVWGTQYYAPRNTNSAVIGAQLYQNDAAKWFYNYMKVAYRYISPADLLYKTFSDTDGSPPDALPKARLFPHSGYVLMRDSWDADKNTLLTFKSSSFYSFNHHHRDNNAFTIYYKGPLAIDSGGYNVCGAWGSKHWWNYYIRTIAHNSIVVYDPNEQFKYGSKLVSNDGGQKFFEIGTPHVQDMKPGGANHLDGVTRFEDTPDYAYALGDATKAYSQGKLSLFQRSVVYLRQHSYDHPAVVIYDDVVATDPSFTKTYLLHSIGKPSLTGDLATITISTRDDPKDKALLFQRTLLPANANISLVGGDGHEFYVSDDGTGTPHNYKSECTGKGYPKVEEQKGAWRVQVQPATPSGEDIFLNVLSVTDDTDGSRDPVHTSLASSQHLRGAFVTDPDGKESTLVLFAKKGAALDDTISIPSLTPKHVLVVGLAPAKRYDWKVSATEVSLRENPTGNDQPTAQGTLYQ